METELLRRYPAFRRFWASTVLTTVGGQLTAVAVPLQIYDLTRSSAWVGLASLAGLAPLVLFALWGGALADAVDRRRMLLATGAGIALVSALLWAQAVAGLGSVAVLLLLVAVQQGLFGANAAVRGAVLPRLVPPERLTGANALMGVVTWSGGIAGPLLAGGLAGTVGLGPLYLLDAVALVLALLTLRRLPGLAAPERVGSRRAGLREVGAGLRYLTGHRILLTAYLADAIAMFFGMPAALFPQLAEERFGRSAIGMLGAAMAIGAVAANCLSRPLGRTRRHGAMVTLAVCAWGLAVAAFGASRSLWFAIAFLALSGSAIAVLSMFRKTILQSASSDALRGRLQGLDTVVAAGGPRLAGLAHGAVGAGCGTTWAITGGGLLAVLGMVAAVAAWPAFWHYRPETAPAAAPADLAEPAKPADPGPARRLVAAAPDAAARPDGP
ncbi:MFS transporter [Kitasatospora azatica]|uniref:MFS transporter n=1 Tax=Kitasatospora azatica TaxID=58347 RepID=UPI0007C76B17|nr:MFS transporter [Kitasatospora azatica]